MGGKRLYWQVFFAYLGITAILLLGLGLYASHEASVFYLNQKAAELEVGAKVCAARIGSLVGHSSAESIENTASIETLCQDLGTSLGMRMTVVLPTGEVVGDSAENPKLLENHLDRPEIQQALTGAVGRSTRYSTTLRQELMYVAVAVQREGAVAAVARASFPIRDARSNTGHCVRSDYRRRADRCPLCRGGQCRRRAGDRSTSGGPAVRRGTFCPRRSEAPTAHRGRRGGPETHPFHEPDGRAIGPADPRDRQP